MSLLIIDNQDSFTNLLVDYFLCLDINCKIIRAEEFSSVDVAAYSGVVFSPGPGNPADHPIMSNILENYHTRLPILGICLGHQAIGSFFGAKVEKGVKPMHGKISRIICKENGLFSGMPLIFNVVRYHSLILNEIPSELECLAETELGEPMIIKHKKLPIYGIQFHPEAILTEYGKELLENWLNLSGLKR